VTLDEARTMCRVDPGDPREGLLELAIAAATGHVENHCGRSLMAQGWELTLDAFSDAIRIPRGPVTAVTAVVYTDPDGAEQTVDTATYSVDLVSDPQWVVLNAETSWPDTLDAVNAVRIRYTAGYDPLPAPITQAVHVLVRAWFDDPAAAAPRAVRQLLEDFRAFPAC
jgi:uncharacterized phiE125 gp8 family phage protein